MSLWKKVLLVSLCLLMGLVSFWPQVAQARAHERKVARYQATVAALLLQDGASSLSSLGADIQAAAAAFGIPAMDQSLSGMAAPPARPLGGDPPGTPARLHDILDPYVANEGVEGLLLVNKKNECADPPANHYDLEQCVDRDSTVDAGWYGASIVSEIDQNENIHGADDDYTSYYAGYIYIDRAWTWHFRTESDGSSEIQIDGRVIVSKYGGPGSAEWHTYLEIGWHHIVYRHQELTGDQYARGYFHDGWDWDGSSWIPLSSDNIPLRALPPEQGLLLVNKQNTCDAHAADHDGLIECVEFTSLPEVDRYGASVVDRISHSSNIHGEDDGYTSRYEGNFLVEPGQAGTWTFRTESDDSSEIEVNGTIVAGVYGGYGNDTGTMDLAEGWHQIIYRHQERSGGQLALAQFQAPGDTAWRTFRTSELTLQAFAADRDWDGLPDSVEGVLGTDPESPDSDMDELGDLFEAVAELDPLSPDSNGDDLVDYLEIVHEGSLDAGRDLDGDGTPNVWDDDNDGDGVPDNLDPSPFSQTGEYWDFDFEIETTGNPTYVDFQLRPENAELLNYTNGVWDWPDDYDAQMQDIDHSREDLRIVPMLEITADSYPDQSQVEDYGISVVNAFRPSDWTGAIQVGGIGGQTDGGGSALGDINGNGTPDLILMGVDDPDGANEFRYRVGWDLDGNGQTDDWSDTIRAEGVGGTFGLGEHNDGGGAAIGYIDNNATPDLLLMAVYANPGDSNIFIYTIGWNLDAGTGEPESWRPAGSVPGLGYNTAGGGVALADINGSGGAELVLMGIDNPDGTNQFWYKIGWDLSSDGWTDDWSDVTGVGKLGYETAGGGAAIADVNQNGTPDMVLMGVDDPDGANSFWYQVGWDLDSTGQAATWSEYATKDGPGDKTDGGGTAIADLNGNGLLDILLMGVDDSAGDNGFTYRVGWDIENKLHVPLSPVQDQGTTVALSGRLFLPASEPGAISLNAHLVWLVQAKTEQFGQMPFGPVYSSDPLYSVQENSPPDPDSVVQLYAAAGGAALGDLDDEEDRPDLLASGICTYGPEGGAQSGLDLNFCYRIGWDVDDRGEAASWSDVQRWDHDLVREYPSTWSDFYGGGAAIADIDGSPQPDLILMGIDFESHNFETGRDSVSSFWYVVGHDIQATGAVGHWGALHRSPAGGMPMTDGFARGAGAAVADIDDNGTLDLVLMTRVNDDGNWRLRYWVGWDIDDDGTPLNGWSLMAETPAGLSIPEGYGAGADLADLNDNGSLDLVMTLVKYAYGDDELQYLVAWDLDETGQPAHWTELRPVPHDLGDTNEEKKDHLGGGAAVGDLDNNGLPDLVAAAVHMPANASEREMKYVVGWDLGSATDNTLARYWERFYLTSFKVEENHGSELGILSSDESDEAANRDEATRACGVLRYEWLISENPLSDAPGKLSENGVEVSARLESYSHHDEALIASADVINETLDTLIDGADLPLIVALQDTATSIWMDSQAEGSSGKLGNSFVLDVAAEPQATVKTLRMPWYDTDANEPLYLEELVDLVQDWGEAAGWEDQDIEQAAMLAAAWDHGESRLTEVGVQSTVFEPFEKNLALKALKTGATTMGKIAKVPGLINGLSMFRTAWSKGAGLVEAAKTGLAYRKVVSGMRVSPGGINRVQKALGRPLRANEYGRLAKWSRAAKWARAAGILLDAGAAAFAFYQVADQLGWTTYGITAGVYYGMTSLAWGLLLQMLASMGTVGLVLSTLVLLSDLLYWAITGESWTVKMLNRIFGGILNPETHFHCEPDLDLNDAVMEVVDADRNGLDVGDQIRYDMLARESSKCSWYAWYYECEETYIHPSTRFEVGAGYPDVVAEWSDDESVAVNTCDECRYDRCEGNETASDWELAAWVSFDQAAINVPLQLSYSSSYRFWYTSDDDGEEEVQDTKTNKLSWLYFDVLPGSVEGVATWDSLTDLDPDHDGLLTHGTAQEVAADGTILDTDPLLWDTDGDGLPDGFEVAAGTDPLLADADGDGFPDALELQNGTDSEDADSDDDGLSDGEEFNGWTITVDYYQTTLVLDVESNPLRADTDGDGLNDSEDKAQGLNPSSIDTDGDGVWDPFEGAPEAAAGGPYTVPEGGSVVLDGTGSTGSHGPLTYAWDYDGDGEYDDASGPEPTFSAAGLDGPDSVEVTLEACDEAYPDSCDTDTAEVTVENVAPSVDADNASVTVDEGDVAANTGTVSDPGGDELTLSASAGVVADNGDGTWSWSFESTDGPDETQTVTITVTDGDDASDSTTFDLAVNNVAPSVDADYATVTVNEGDGAANTGTVSDPGADELTLSASAGVVADNGDGTWSWSFGSTDGPDETQTVTVTVTDSAGASDSTTFELTVDNVAPSVVADNASVTVNEGDGAANSGAVSDPGDDEVTLSASAGMLVDYGDGSWGWWFDSSDGPDESQTVTITATDSDGVAGSTTFDLVVDNVAPSASADNSSVTVDEGQPASNSGSFSDPGEDDVTISASAGSISQETGSSGAWSWSFDSSDGPDESQTVTITAMDSDGDASSTSFALAVNNVAPSVDGITAPPGPVAIDDQPITVEVAFSDPGNDIHDVTFDWDDDSSDTLFDLPDSPASAQHEYDEAGVYEILVRVEDDDTAFAEFFYQYVIVYDPSAGFVTGGGWIDSPAGAYRPDPQLTGKANSGFVAKYKKGRSVPGGETEFQFQAGDLNFHSESYDFLVVNQGGRNAQFKGSGTINGELAPNDELYKFMIWAGDDSPDTFRIKIWYEVSSDETLVYDNDVDQPIGGGSIVIHAK